MAKLRSIYKCNICGNIVEVLHSGAGKLVCCGQPMELQQKNTVDAAQEKHVPIIEKIGDNYLIKIGKIAHPMEESHYIEWIEAKTEAGFCKKLLKPKDAPEFALKTEIKGASAYCNLHGLWNS